MPFRQVCDRRRAAGYAVPKACHSRCRSSLSHQGREARALTSGVGCREIAVGISGANARPMAATERHAGRVAESRLRSRVLRTVKVRLGRCAVHPSGNHHRGLGSVAISRDARAGIPKRRVREDVPEVPGAIKRVLDPKSASPTRGDRNGKKEVTCISVLWHCLGCARRVLKGRFRSR